MTAGSPEKILVIRLSSIGDILLTFPLVRLLRRRFPLAQIDYCIKSRYAELLLHHPHIHRLLILEQKMGWRGLVGLRKLIRAEKYDLIVDIHRNLRSVFLRDQHAKIVTYPKYYLKRWLLVRLGWNLFTRIVPMYRRYLKSLQAWQVQDDGLGLEFFLTDKEKQFALSLLAEKKIAVTERRIGFAVGASYETKQWPVEYFVRLAETLLKSPGKIFLFGDDKDRARTQQIVDAVDTSVINVSGQLTLRQTAALIAQMDVMVTNDSGLMHLATALKSKTVSIFGSTTAELGFYPDAPFTRVVENLNLFCRPCSHVGRHRCPKDHFRCMKEVTPESVYQAVASLLNS